MRKYLEELGITESEICVPMTENVDEDRDAFFKKERQECGFDSRETWALNHTAAIWLYEHLRMYLDIAQNVVDLTFYKFNVREIVADPEVWKVQELALIPVFIEEKESEMSQIDCIRLCLEYLKDYIQSDEILQDKAREEHPESRFAESIQEEIDVQKGQMAFHNFAEILPAMWW